MIRPITICALFAAATLFHCDGNAQEINKFDNGADSNTRDGAFADASPAELELLRRSTNHCEKFSLST